MHVDSGDATVVRFSTSAITFAVLWTGLLSVPAYAEQTKSFTVVVNCNEPVPTGFWKKQPPLFAPDTAAHPFRLIYSKDHHQVIVTGLPEGCWVQTLAGAKIAESRAELDQTTGETVDFASKMVVSQLTSFKSAFAYYDQMLEKCERNPQRFLRLYKYVYEPDKYMFSLPQGGLGEEASFCSRLFDQNTFASIFRTGERSVVIVAVGKKVFYEEY